MFPRLLVLSCALIFVLPAGAQAIDPAIARAESFYADFNDATAAAGTIESGYADSFAGKSLAQWKKLQSDSRKQLAWELKSASGKKLSLSDARALQLMRVAIAGPADDGSGPKLHCSDATRTNLSYRQLSRALYACFDEVGDNLTFEAKPLTRGDAFGKMEELSDPARRKAAFLSMVPLYTAINGGDKPNSPYRRLIKLAAQQKTSEVANAAKTLGATPNEVEHWLEEILDTWRQATGDKPVEPWDYRYVAGTAGRELDSAIPLEKLQPITQRYYRDLGADLAQLGVIYDLDPRPGKSPVAYTDFARRGRAVNGHWQPTIARVLANYSSGGLGNLNEFVHENGHAVQISAIHTRPAFMDWGDTVFVEAFADVPSWNTYDVEWQKKYLGRSASEDDNLRALYCGVMLDVAWSLFEIRMLKNPTQDPNQLWTDITSHYLHIVPHPELSWWAVRGQLVDAPGYMVNYGLGAVITADLRARITEKLGSFQTGNEQWFPWLTKNLLRFGAERETSDLLRDFIGRSVTPDALIRDLRRMTPVPTRAAASSLTTSH